MCILKKKHFGPTLIFSLSFNVQEDCQSDTLSIKLPIVKCVHEKQNLLLHAHLRQFIPGRKLHPFAKFACSMLLLPCIHCSKRILIFRNFIFTAATLVPCVGRKTSPHYIIAQIIFSGSFGSLSSFTVIFKMDFG